jgi:hypothetical protein
MQIMRDLLDSESAAIIAMVVAATLLAIRWRRIGRGALLGLGWLADENLRLVHRAARRRLFVDSLWFASLTCLAMFAIAAAELIWRTLQSPSGAFTPDLFARLLPASTANALGRALLATATLEICWLTWTLLTPWIAARQHWLWTLRRLHEYRNSPINPAEHQTTAALAYCSAADVLSAAWQRVKPGEIVPASDKLWYEWLLLSINRAHSRLESDSDKRQQRHDLVLALRSATSTQPLLDRRRIRAAFGVAGRQVLATAILGLAAWCSLWFTAAVARSF